MGTPALLIHPALAEIYRQKVAAMHEALRDPGTRDEAFGIIRSLIDEIRLVPVDGELGIEIKGELAGTGKAAASIVTLRSQRQQCTSIR